MILNTGSRTDIPAYFSDWFYNRVKEGLVCMRNPYFPAQVTRYRLDASVVDCLVFCTKNPEPMLERLSELDAFGQYWFVTITPYGKEIEPNVPDKSLVRKNFRALSAAVGAKRICWRYDPIFIDLYEKTLRNFKGVKSVGTRERHIIGREFAEIGKKYGIRLSLLLCKL